MWSYFKSIIRYGWFGLLFLAVGVGMIVISFFTTHTNWPKTEAVVTRIQIESGSGKSTSHIPYVSYDIPPSEHYDEIRLDTYISGVTEVGNTVSIRYNPSNHREITYYYSSPLSSITFVAGLIFSFIGVGVAISSGRNHAELTPIN